MVKLISMHSGLKDWWMQRISAVMVSVFALPVLVMWFGGWLDQDYVWYTFLSSLVGKTITLIGLLGFALHIRIGLWVVITDYVPRAMQAMIIWVINTWIFGLFVWGGYLLWML